MLRQDEEHPLGTSKRYADHYDRRMSERVLERAMTETPETLVDEELGLDVQPLTRPPKPTPVVVWVRYGGSPVKVEGRAVAWTPKAVAVEWKTPAGAVHRAWVWSSAVV
jgi:hypothetical protein